MDPTLLAVLAKEGLSLGVKLVTQAIAAGAMTQDQADDILTEAQAGWGLAAKGWRDARAEKPGA